MATDTQLCGIQFHWLDSGWVLSVLRQRAVTGFTIHARMFAFGLDVQNFRVAGHTGLMSRISNRMGLGFHKSIAAIVAVLAKAFRHKKTPHHKKKQHSGGYYPSQP